MGDDSNSKATENGPDEIQHKIQEDNYNKRDLEALNNAITEINQLSSLVYHSRVAFRQHLQVSREQLDKLFTSLRRHILACRPYHEARDALAAATDTLREVSDEYSRACLEEEDAKENAEVAERALMAVLAADADPHPDVLANLNKATKWVAVCTDARDEARVHKARADDDVVRRRAALDRLTVQLKRSLVRARPYFELRDRLKYQLDSQVEELQQQQAKLTEAKEKYRAVFASLDVITCRLAREEGIEGPLLEGGRELSHFMDIDTIESFPLDPYYNYEHPTKASSTDGDMASSAASSIATSTPSNPNVDFPSDCSDNEDDLCNLSDDDDRIELSLGSLSLDDGAWRDMHTDINRNADSKDKLDHFPSTFQMNL